MNKGMLKNIETISDIIAERKKDATPSELEDFEVIIKLCSEVMDQLTARDKN